MYKGISRENLRKLLQFLLNNTYFKVNGEIYKQKYLTMGVSPSPTIANIFLNYLEIQYLAEFSR